MIPCPLVVSRASDVLSGQLVNTWPCLGVRPCPLGLFPALLQGCSFHGCCCDSVRHGMCAQWVSDGFWMDRPAWTHCTCPSQNAMIVCILQLHQLDLCLFRNGQVCMNLLHLSTTDFYDCAQLSAASMTKHNWCYWLSWTSTVLPPLLFCMSVVCWIIVMNA